MKHWLRMLGMLVLLSPVGCAGGWKSGQAPAGYAPPSSAHWSISPDDHAVWVANPADAGAGAAAAAPMAVAATKPAAQVSTSKAPAGSATQGLADGAMFRFKGAANSVNVAGEFNAWSTSADAMTKGADGVWTLKKPLAAGRYAYKFVVNGTEWKPDDTAAESLDDGFGGKNSVVVVSGAGAAATPAAPAAAVAPPAAAGLANQGITDGAMFRFKGAANSVNVAGEFNAWSTSADAMTKGADGVWTLKKPLAAGRYAYKFVVNGTEWKPDDTAAESLDDGFGGKNSVVVVSGAGAAATPAAPATRAPAVDTAGPLGMGQAPVITAQGVRFTFGGARAGSVFLAGDFNNWATNLDPLEQGSDGSWTVVKKLPPGTHHYKFVLDGTTWKHDEQNPAVEDDGFGGQNSVVVVK